MSIKIEDESNVDQYLNVFKQLQSKQLQIGIFGEDDSKMLMIARVNEFGVKIDVTDKMRGYLHSIGIHLKEETSQINIPERSFMRNGFDKNYKKIQRKAEKLLERVLTLELSVNVFYKTLGEYIVSIIQEFLTNLRKPANHPATIDQKGSSNPLIGEGRLRQSITYKVV